MTRDEWVAVFVAIVGALIIAVTAFDRWTARPRVGIALVIPDPTEDEPAWATEQCGEYPPVVLTPGEERHIADLRDGLADGGQFEEPTPTLRETSIDMGQLHLGRRGEPTS